VLEFRVRFCWEDPMPSIQNRPSTKLVGDRHHCSCSSAATHFAASHPTHVHSDRNLPQLTFFFSLLRSVLPHPAKRQGGFLAWTAKLQNFFPSFSKIRKIKPKKKLDDFWLTLSALFEFRVSCSSRPSLICVRVDRYCMITVATSQLRQNFSPFAKIFCKKHIKSVTNRQKLTQLYTLWKGA